MGRSRKQPELEQAAGAPEWMVTFSDCMTLLLTFFVLLLSFSSFDDKVFRKLKVIFAEALPSVSPETTRDKDAFLDTPQFMYQQEIDKGSEKPTLSSGTENNLKEDTKPVDFRNRKVFLIPSGRIFWGKGTVISFRGRRILSAMASFLKEAPNRIVISENKHSADNSEHLGLRRAWAVLNYLTSKQAVDKSRFSISAASTLRETGDDERRMNERMLEIVLLEQSIYN
ncbi:MAG: hypothetical protein DRP62_02505 [Planctomycetota bacterium]|nr:MAG: hypothetical protein DRP62_02505 [Planctomycetota bacterium]